MSFDDKGVLKIDKENITLNLIDTKNAYDLSVRRFDKVIFSKKDVQGVSKVLHIDDWVLFSFYTAFFEDGANEGLAVIINIKSGIVKIFDKVLHTSNPVIINKMLYLVNDLQLIEADLDFNIQRTFSISYFSNNDPYSYLDTYLICGLSLNRNKDTLLIEFTPVKADSSCKFYEGAIGDKNDIILLKE